MSNSLTPESKEATPQKRTLFQLTADQRAIDDLLAESGGEITDETTEAFVSKCMEEITSGLAEKADSYKFKQDYIKSQMELFKSYENQFYMAKKSLERLSKALRDRLEQSMISMDKTVLEGNMFKYSLSKSKPSVFISDESLIPSNYARTKMVIEIDKNLIKEDLEAGFKVPGASLETGFTLRVGVNKGK